MDARLQWTKLPADRQRASNRWLMMPPECVLWSGCHTWEVRCQGVSAGVLAPARVRASKAVMQLCSTHPCCSAARHRGVLSTAVIKSLAVVRGDVNLTTSHYA